VAQQRKFGGGVIQALMEGSGDQIDLFNACGVSIDELPAIPLCLCNSLMA
jgi:hypothetical protein